MPEIKLLLVVGRILKQGVGISMGKHNAEYREAVSTLEMNAGDMTALGVQNGDEVELTSPYGQTCVHCKPGNLPAGMAFIAYGPPTSDLTGTETYASGMPDFKTQDVVARALGGGRD